MAWRTRQTYGPSPRHPSACVELQFTTETAGEAASGDVRPTFERLRSAGIALPLPVSPMPLPQAVGTIAAGVLAHQFDPAWSWGCDADHGWVCLSHPEPKLAEAALIGAFQLLSAGTDHPPRIIGDLAKIAAAARSLNPNNMMMRRAAEELQLDTANLSSFLPVYQIGQGARSVHYCELASEADGFTGHLLSKDKRATLEVLARNGLPTSRSLNVGSRAQLAEAVRQVGFPCVVKPVAAGSGRGVTAGITSAERLEAAVDEALRHGGYPFLLESFVAGDDHRMTVVNGQLTWVYRRRPPYVVGDGQADIAELVDRENRRRRDAGPAHALYLQPIALDAAVRLYLRERYDYDEASVPAADQRVELTGVANIARGGTLKDVTRRVHPDNRDLALRVARVFRLHTVGVDLITTDIAKSWRELPCALIEINTAPGISGVGDASVVLRLAFPRRLSGRIPCFVVAGDIAYRQEVAGGLLAALKKAGLATGRADFGDDMTGFDDVQNLLRESRVGAVIVTCPQEAVERCGFPLPRCEILFAEEAHPWTGIAGLAGRRIAGPLAPREVERLTDEAVRPFVSGELGGPRPTLEWLAAAGQPKIRLWRSWTMPAARFWGAILARTVTHNGMAGPGDILSAVVHLADAELARDGQEPTGVRFALAGTDAPWQAAYEDVDVPLLPERAAIVEAALRRAIERVSELVVRSY